MMFPPQHYLRLAPGFTRTPGPAAPSSGSRVTSAAAKAMAAKMTKWLWEIGDIVAVLEAWEGAVDELP
jgi:hypothetical protein